MAGLQAMSVLLIVKLMVFAIIVYSLLTYWTDWFQAWVMENLGLKQDNKGLLTFAVIATLAAIVALLVFKINPVYILDVNTKKLGLDK